MGKEVLGRNKEESLRNFYENWRANGLGKYSMTDMKGPLKVKGDKFEVTLVTYFRGRSRLDRIGFNSKSRKSQGRDYDEGTNMIFKLLRKEVKK